MDDIGHEAPNNIVVLRPSFCLRIWDFHEPNGVMEDVLHGIRACEIVESPIRQDPQEYRRVLSSHFELRQQSINKADLWGRRNLNRKSHGVQKFIDKSEGKFWRGKNFNQLTELMNVTHGKQILFQRGLNIFENSVWLATFFVRFAGLFRDNFPEQIIFQQVFHVVGREVSMEICESLDVVDVGEEHNVFWVFLSYLLYQRQIFSPNFFDSLVLRELIAQSVQEQTVLDETLIHSELIVFESVYLQQILIVVLQPDVFPGQFIQVGQIALVEFFFLVNSLDGVNMVFFQEVFPE